MRALAWTMLLLLAGCSATSSTTALRYSGQFSLPVPTHLLAAGSLLALDGLTLKTADGVTLSGVIITREFEGLPPSFPLLDYPEIVLKKKDASKLSDAGREFLAGVSAELNHSYGLHNLEIIRNGEATLYVLCRDERCLAYITKTGVESHFLLMTSEGLAEACFKELIREI